MRLNHASVCRAAFALCFSAGACTVEQAPSPQSISTLDRGAFDRCIEPILVRNCSYTACHGNEGFALRVYSIGKLRAKGTANNLTALTALLTSEEHDANFRSAVALTYGRPFPEDNLLLRKPMPGSAGGFEHKGGA